MKPIRLVLSCEHATNHIPKAFEHYFVANQELLKSHRGMDFGALEVAEYLSKSFQCTLITATVSRLLIDCNRSLSHPNCFSEISKNLSLVERNQLVQQYYLPFRQTMEQTIATQIASGHQVWHLSVHSFTPIMNGITRRAEIGLLYDPKRIIEKSLAHKWHRLLKHQGKHLRIRRNYPYYGTSNGFTTTLRKKFAESDYVGIELEKSQLLSQEPESLLAVVQVLDTTLHMLIHEH